MHKSSTGTFRDKSKRSYSSFQGKGRSFGSRSGGSRFSGGRRGGGGNRNPGENIDIARFIKKAVPVVVGEEFVSTNKFSDFNLHPELETNILAKGFDSPMPIQDMAIPAALSGKDVIGLANTGTGKTAAFLIPLVHKTLKHPEHNHKTLIIAPTRELADQIREELRHLTKGMRIFSTLIIGGTSMSRQISELRRGVQFVIGTPGRIKDLAQRKSIRFNEFTSIVLDEVDRMFDMGFSKEITEIMKQLPLERQSLFFSATINKAVDDLIIQNSTDAVKISVVTGETAASVEQDIVQVDSASGKFGALIDLLAREKCEKALIFGRTKAGVNRLALELKDKGFKADAIHGNKSQSQRQRSLNMFKEDRINILVATDVAARGLDIPLVSHVINYDVPATYADYVHRIGRAGRAKATGKAFTFVGAR